MRSPKHLAADGGITEKRHHKPKKPSRKEKMTEEIASNFEEQVAGGGIRKEKRTNKPTTGDEVMKEMKTLARLLSEILWKYRPTEETASEKLMEETTPEFQEKTEFDRTKGYTEIKEEITSEFQENREFHHTKGYAKIKEG